MAKMMVSSVCVLIIAAILSGPTAAEMDLDRGAVLIMHLDDEPGATTIIDSSGYNNKGSCDGILPMLGVSGVNGTAALFTKKSIGKNRIDIPSSKSLNMPEQLTISVWVNALAAKPDGDSFIVRKEDEYHISFPENMSAWYPAFSILGFGSQSIGVTSNKAMQPGEFHHLVAIFNRNYLSNNMQLWMDGELVASGGDSRKIPPTNDVLSIGDGQPFRGIIDELRIYNRALWEDDIKALYEQGKKSRDEKKQRAA
jgi:hypothetical protein